MSKKTASVIGIVLGVVMIIIGLCVMNPETYTLGTRDSLGSLINFGGDYQTEMYHITYQAAHQVQKAYVNICNAIGWLIIAIGLLDIGYFLCKTASCEQNDSNTTNNIVPSVAAPTTNQSMQRQTAANPCRPAATHSWRCDNCGKMATKSPCEHCGRSEDAPKAPYRCGKCGHEGPYEVNCPSCGSSLKFYNY